MGSTYNNILDRIGNTPLVPIRQLNTNGNVQVLAKLECFNPGGSVKDRPALAMIEEGEGNGDLTREKIILEATSGNTGIGLSLVRRICGRYGWNIDIDSREGRGTLIRLSFQPSSAGT